MDLEDLYRRVADHLAGPLPQRATWSGDNLVVLAESLTPSEASSLHDANVTGFATEKGARTSHTAIIARSLEIPAVVGVKGMLKAAEARQPDAALQRHDQIRAKYGDTGYAALAGLHAAKLKLEAGDARAARELLETVRREATDPAIQEVATLRIARLYIDAGELDAARRLVDGMPKGAFGSQLAELRGDLARAGGDVDAARAAYEEALAGRHTGSNLLRFKLQDVAPPNG